MSDFECINGHEMRPSQGGRCKKCGGRVYRMDGETDKQIRRREAAEARWEREDEDNEEEDNEDD